jgi:hypothetical protein
MCRYADVYICINKNARVHAGDDHKLNNYTACLIKIHRNRTCGISYTPVSLVAVFMGSKGTRKHMFRNASALKHARQLATTGIIIWSASPSVIKLGWLFG